MLLDLSSITVKITYDKLMPCQTVKNGSLIHLLWGMYVRKHLLFIYFVAPGCMQDLSSLAKNLTAPLNWEHRVSSLDDRKSQEASF